MGAAPSGAAAWGGDSTEAGGMGAAPSGLAASGGGCTEAGGMEPALSGVAASGGEATEADGKGATGVEVGGADAGVSAREDSPPKDRGNGGSSNSVERANLPSGPITNRAKHPGHLMESVEPTAASIWVPQEIQVNDIFFKN